MTVVCPGVVGGNIWFCYASDCTNKCEIPFGKNCLTWAVSSPPVEISMGGKKEASSFELSRLGKISASFRPRLASNLCAVALMCFPLKIQRLH